MRRAPERAPAPFVEKNVAREVRTYEFLTPVFGGGVEVVDHRKPCDERTPIRVASVRGQLRFWWRACNPRGCTTVEELQERESAVFGSTEKASELAVTYIGPEPSRSDRQVFEWRRSRGGKYNVSPLRGLEAIGYGAFPLRAEDKNKDGSLPPDHGVLHKYEGSWQLAFDYPEQVRLDVEAALWAWAHFGGLGGRTRRGFGAISQMNPELLSIEQGWETYVSGLEVSWPYIQTDRARWLRLGSPERYALEAQTDLLGKLQRLRQADQGRKPDPENRDDQYNHPGRSYWPEADAIRQVTHQQSHSHQNRVTNPNKFPRAAFGMPIIFHFKDRGDPPDLTLLPEGKGRLASPLILRPHRRPDGMVEPLALVLGHPTPAGYELKSSKRAQPVQTQLTDHEAKSMGVGGRPSPMVTNAGEPNETVFTDPLERFLEEIR